MFEQLFTNPAAIACHRAAPYAEERARYLTHCSQQGYSHATLLLKAGVPVKVVSERLGHANPATTLRAYRRASPWRARVL